MKTNKLFLIALTMLWSLQVSAQSLPLDFETGTITFTDFSGGVLTVVNNPHSTGINTSAKVAQMVKGVGDPWGGSYLTLTDPIDFSTKKFFKIKVYSPRSDAKLLFKVENLTDGAKAMEVEKTIGVANEWVELTYDFSGINMANTYQKIVMICDLGTIGDGSANFTWQLDDISQASATGPVKSVPTLPISFEDTATVNYNLGDFGGNASSIVVDPTNASNLVVKAVKTAVAETWGGTTAGNNGLAQVIPVTASETKMSVRVWSPTANTPILLKIEVQGTPSQSVETLKNTTVAGAWEILVFDFANQAPGTAALNVAFPYNKVSIFFNFGTSGATAGEATYYFDDITFGVLSSVDNLLSRGFKYYPNPVANELNFSAEENITRVEIMNLMGQQIMSADLANTHASMDVSSLPAGIYVVRATIANETGTFRIVKN